MESERRNNNYQKLTESFKVFLNGFNALNKGNYYFHEIENIAKNSKTELTIKMDDICSFETLGESFGKTMIENVLRYKNALYDAIDQILKEIDVPLVPNNQKSADEMFKLHRMQFSLLHNQQLPSSLLRNYELIITAPSFLKEMGVRQLRGSDIGSLVKVKVMVTRISEVKPKMMVATYTCIQCGGEIFQEILSPQFMPLSNCPNEECLRANINGAKLIMQTRGSKFVKFQEIRIQELASQVPIGHTPRSMTIHAKGSSTRKANPGDIITVTGASLDSGFFNVNVSTGCYLPIIDSGYTAMKSGLLATTFIEVFNIEISKQVNDSFVLSPSDQEELNVLLKNPEMSYQKLTQCFAPEIFGHEDVKKALILLLVGGISKNDETNNLKLRGDINVCLMGDPGVAKSQLLKYLCMIAPRGIYTTGKGSSGVGLTASIQKDPLTEDFLLEGGALVLADKGICAIDEFDKMDEGDRTSIYEVMEQQTVSIAKAGITTTLNARTSIVAAANPLYGRYNDQKSLSENINLPSALLSRFDLLFLLLDRPCIESDICLAEHVTYVHQHSKHPNASSVVLSIDVIRVYLSMAKQVHCDIPPDVSDYLIDNYVEMRNKTHLKNDNEIKITPRTLLAIIRLSTAMARLRLSSEVLLSDVDESIRLMNSANVSLSAEKISRRERRSNFKDYVYAIIQSLLNASSNGIISYNRAKQSVINRGYNERQFEITIHTYQETSIIMVDDAKTIIKTIN